MTDAIVPLFRAGVWYESLDVVAVPNSDLRLCLAPEILLREERKRRDAQRPAVPTARRREILRQAAELFRRGDLEVPGLGRQSFDDFAAALRRIAGLPDTLTERWADALVERLASLHAAAADDATVLVWLPSNTFTCLEAVGEAVLIGGTVWLRPSHREPLSAARFVTALLAAGWPAHRLALLSTSNALLGTLVRLTDRQIVYGGPELEAALPEAPNMTFRGPGRGCALVERNADPVAAAAWLAELVVANAGRFCTNVRTIGCFGDPEPVAVELARTLDSVKLDPPDPRWPLAALPAGFARSVAGQILAGLAPGDRILTRRDLAGGPDDPVVLPPTLVRLRQWQPEHPLLRVEPPFPFATVVAVDAIGATHLVENSRYVYRTGEVTPV